jgi:membrane protein DedA with SNARE-associated domain
MLGILEQAFDWLKDYSSSPWFYVVLLTIAFLDSVFPIVPSETMVIIGGVSAGLHDLHWSLVILFAAVGAFSGDNFSYHIGVFFSERLQRRYNKNDKGRQRLQWAHNQIETRGGELLVTARFIPGGRTIVTLTCGITGQSTKWFMKWSAVAASIWATYATMLGFIGGRTFQENHTKAFLVAFALAIGATIILEIIRYVRGKRSSAHHE